MSLSRKEKYFYGKRESTFYPYLYYVLICQVFQCLLIEGENCGDIDPVKKMPDATDQVVTDEQFQFFLKTHEHIKCLVPESNTAMRNSYLILDEYMRYTLHRPFHTRNG